MSPDESERPKTIHASAVVIGEAGVLIRGQSGSGKSSLARELIREAEREGRFARLVADDRVRLVHRHGRLVARPHPDLAGLLEVRGLGISTTAHEPECVVRLLVECCPDPPRLPEEAEAVSVLGGVRLPRIWVNGPLGSRVVLCRLWSDAAPV